MFAPVNSSGRSIQVTRTRLFYSHKNTTAKMCRWLYCFQKLTRVTDCVQSLSIPSPSENTATSVLSLHTDRPTLRKGQDRQGRWGSEKRAALSLVQAQWGQPSVTYLHDHVPLTTLWPRKRSQQPRRQTQDTISQQTDPKPKQVKGRRGTNQDTTPYPSREHPNFQEGERCGRFRGPRGKFKVGVDNSWTGQVLHRIW